MENHIRDLARPHADMGRILCGPILLGHKQSDGELNFMCLNSRLPRLAKTQRKHKI